MTIQVWKMHGHIYHVSLWSPSEWERLPLEERPPTAFDCEGRGWADVRPAVPLMKSCRPEGTDPTTPWPKPLH
jgi:hypothetical protein